MVNSIGYCCAGTDNKHSRIPTAIPDKCSTYARLAQLLTAAIITTPTAIF
jgi:hypothetical protein